MKCKNCLNSLREYNGKRFVWYCEMQTSGTSKNGYKPIKANDEKCYLFIEYKGKKLCTDYQKIMTYYILI